jgi:hypothetical protein
MVIFYAQYISTIRKLKELGEVSTW